MCLQHQLENIPAEDLNIVTYIKVVLDNNQEGLLEALKANGILLNGTTKQAAIELLYDLYLTNPNLFFNILKAVPYNETTPNYTTDPAFKQEVYNSLGGNNVARTGLREGNFLTDLGDFIGGTTTTQVTTTMGGTVVPVAAAKGSNTPVIILSILAFVVLGTIIYLAFKR